MSFEAFEAIMESRMRLMLRNRWLVGIFVILLIGGLIVVGAYILQQPTGLRIAVGPAGSLDARLVETLGKTFDADHAPYRLHQIETKGPVDSGRLLEEGKADLAIVRSDLGISQHGLVVAVVHRNVMVLMVPPAAARQGKKGKSSSKIEKVGDLAGKRIGIVSSNDATPDLLNIILSHYGVAADQVKITQVPVDALGKAAANNEIDAVFVVAPEGSKLMMDSVAALTQKKEAPTFLDEQSEAIAKANPGYESTEVSAGGFGGTPPSPDDDLKTLSATHYMVARKGLSDATVAEFSKLLYGDRQVLAKAFPGVVKIQSPSTDKDAAVTIHPGTAAYLGDSQKSFFDRYGDTIFYGLLILPFFGSAAAGVAGYFKAGGRQRRLRLVNHLMEIVGRARRADTMATLDHLQAEADKILKITLQQITANQMDESIMQSFSLALDQARLAIADRRACLLGQAPPTADMTVHELKTVAKS